MGMEKLNNEPLRQDELKDLAAQKEKEWRQLQDLQSLALENCLHAREKELATEKDKFRKLKEDFKYNLRLLSERDAELARYDRLFTDFKIAETKREAETSDLKARIDELSTKLVKEAAFREEAELQYKKRLREKQGDIEQYRVAKDMELAADRQELESLKRKLERKICELEAEMNTQRRELSMGFDDATRKREHEFRLQLDDMNTTVLAHQLQVKLLTKELEILRSDSSEQKCGEIEERLHEMERQLKRKAWEIEDLCATKDARIAELELKQKQNEESTKKLMDEFHRKYADMDRTIRARDASVTRVRDSAEERERRLAEEMQVMLKRLDESGRRANELQQSLKELELEKNGVMEGLESEIKELTSRWQSDVSELSRVNTSRDAELKTLRDIESRYKSELLQKKHDIERYRSELATALERQADMDRTRAQLELDCQRKCEEVERAQYERSEELVKKLTMARDTALADLALREAGLKHANESLRLVARERDHANATLRRHGIVLDTSISLEEQKEASQERISQLERQNHDLREVVRQMRQEMETLAFTAPLQSLNKPPATPPAPPSSAVVAADSSLVAALEAEIRSLKGKCRELEQRLHDVSRSNLPIGSDGVNDFGRCAGEGETQMSAAVDKAIKENVSIGVHVAQLNETIGRLRSDKAELVVQLRKHQSRAVGSEASHEQLIRQVREKQVQIDQLTYELGALKRRSEAEVLGLKQRVTDLELAITEARRETDEYCKAGIERNNEITALTNQISQLKLDAARANPNINFGAQELLIQQLQDEISRLTCQRQTPISNQALISDVNNATLTDGGDASTIVIGQLKDKLRLAANYIRQLAKEKQLLIEIGNRLRAELTKNGLKLPSQSSTPRQYPVVYSAGDTSAARGMEGGGGEAQQRIHNTLQELERLQYNLTKQELSARQQGRQNETVVSVNRNIPERPDLTNDNDKVLAVNDNDGSRLRSILKPSQQRSDSIKDHMAGPSGSSGADQGQPIVSRTRLPHQPQPQLLQSTSSLGGQSLDELWRMVDAEDNMTPLATASQGMLQSGIFNYRNPAPTKVWAETSPHNGSGDWVVQGTQPAFSNKPANTGQKPLSARTGRTLASKKKPTVRNYNLRDDERRTAT